MIIQKKERRYRFEVKARWSIRTRFDGGDFRFGHALRRWKERFDGAEEVAQVSREQSELGEGLDPRSHPGRQLLDEVGAAEPLIAQKDRAIIAAVSNHTTDSLCTRSTASHKYWFTGQYENMPNAPLELKDGQCRASGIWVSDTDRSLFVGDNVFLRVNSLLSTAVDSRRRGTSEWVSNWMIAGNPSAFPRPM